MRIWFKQWKDSRMVRDLVIEDNSVRDFKRQAKARFTKDCFMEEVPFDYLEIDVIEED